MALLSMLPQSEKFDEALVPGDTASLSALAHGWPYVGYKVTVFSKAEEQQIEEPQLGGRALYYNDEALAAGRSANPECRLLEAQCRCGPRSGYGSAAFL
jgi:hypothetical protein